MVSYKRRVKLLPPANEVWGKVIFSQACVKNYVHGGVCLSACWDTPLGAAPPSRHHPLGAGTLREQTPSSPRSRHPREQTSPREQTPPPLCSACWDWNASLLLLLLLSVPEYSYISQAKHIRSIG